MRLSHILPLLLLLGLPNSWAATVDIEIEKNDPDGLLTVVRYEDPLICKGPRALINQSKQQQHADVLPQKRWITLSFTLAASAEMDAARCSHTISFQGYEPKYRLLIQGDASACNYLVLESRHSEWRPTEPVLRRETTPPPPSDFEGPYCKVIPKLQ